MKLYKILEHTADLKIKFFGKNKRELFSNALLGMFEAIGPEIQNEEIFEREISVSSANFENLLVDFLSEALYQSDINNEAYFKIIFDEFDDTHLKVKICGKKINKFSEEIKAVTYHGLEIKQTKAGWEATVLFDI